MPSPDTLLPPDHRLHRLVLPLLRLQWRRRFPHDQLGRQHDLFRRRVEAGDEGEEEVDGGAGHLLQRLADGGELGVELRGDGDVVEADHRDVAGHGEAGLADGGDGAIGGDVVGGEDGGRPLGEGEQLVGRFEAALGREVAVDLKGRVERQAGLASTSR